ncbi:MAG: hypothetical protein GW795_10375 [Cyanobacteria bacterium]|nr:hypothetical protein [Cyanobacteria bacterium CG_2015-16_32_12]NCO77408.1 hypothetical protein [Cyanobacteria bacterium CG_2015-22_32_23]NCQ03484.1 hypothetical protein [Cyanobacteria bacterium CG_2015-09_32_10]NCQ42265.1 hypothetical protein [Cyanobacteria bacterium CG_2015-04_32_10]NCS83959.1 hypothetical protein [Cyanobacteria bacterium CG_2015-02_32_10]
MNNQSLWNNLYKNACESQKKIIDKILTPERKQQKELLEKLDFSGYEVSFRHKKRQGIVNGETLRIRKRINEKDKHYGYINDSVLKHKNSLFGYCYNFDSDPCPSDFDGNILGFPQDQGWFIDDGKGSDKGKRYVIITSLELANKIFNI